MINQIPIGDMTFILAYLAVFCFVVGFLVSGIRCHRRLRELAEKVVAAPSRDQDIPRQVEGAWKVLKAEAQAIIDGTDGPEKGGT